MPGVVETYDGEIAVLRKDGYSLQSIGDVIGVTRERVRQVLNQYYGGTKIPLLTELQVAKICGCSIPQVVKVRKQGKVSPKIRGGRRYYDSNAIEELFLALQKNCAMCGRPMKSRTKYCVKCSIDYKRNIWPFLSPEKKELQNRASIKWQKEHPERYKIIRARAAEKWRHEHGEEMRAYSLKYYQEHREEMRAYSLKYYQEHKEEIRVRKLNITMSINDEQDIIKET